jgi:hypothetical protein
VITTTGYALELSMKLICVLFSDGGSRTCLRSPFQYAAAALRFRMVPNEAVITTVFTILDCIFHDFGENLENFKVKKLLLDDVLQSSRYYHWIPLDLVYLVVTLRSPKTSHVTGH